MVNPHLPAAADRYAGDRVAGRIALRDRLAPDAASIKAGPRDTLSVVEATFASHDAARTVERDRPAHGIGSRRSADRAILLNDLHSAGRSHRVRQSSDKAIAKHRDVPNVVIHPALKVTEEWLRNNECSTAMGAGVKAATHCIQCNLVHRHMRKS